MGIIYIPQKRRAPFCCSLFQEEIFVVQRLDKNWRLFRTGIIGTQPGVRVNVVRLMNLISEQGTYWLANNFIRGWLLLPVLALGELIKRNSAESADDTLQLCDHFPGCNTCLIGHFSFLAHIPPKCPGHRKPRQSALPRALIAGVLPNVRPQQYNRQYFLWLGSYRSYAGSITPGKCTPIWGRISALWLGLFSSVT